MPPRPWRVPLALVIAALAASASGCLFPPVEPPGEDTDGNDPAGTEGPDPTEPPRPGGTGTRYRTMTDQANAQGEIAVGVGAVADNGETHPFTLPARITDITITLEWEATGAGDLDLAAALREEGGSSTYWSDADAGGSASNPDDEDCTIEVSDAALLSRPAASTLTVEVSAKAAIETSYTVRVDYAYLVPI